MKKAGKALSSFLRKATIVFSFAVPLYFIACKEVNYPPEAKLEVSPLYGEAPLEVRMQVTGTDPNGDDDIKEYKLNINGEVIRSDSPMDITKKFTNPGIVKVYGEVVDSENEKDITNKSSIEIYGIPYMEQSASLINENEINYTASLSRVDKAELKVNKGEEVIFSEEIKDVNQSGTDYEKNIHFLYNK